MRKKDKKVALQLPISIVLFCCSAICAVATTWFSKVDAPYWLLLIPSVLFTVLATAIFHEFGHYIATVKSGFEVYYFRTLAFTIDKYGRKKFKIKPFNASLGEIRFYPQKELNYSVALKKSLLGGLIGGALIALILNLCLILSLLGVFCQEFSKYCVVIFSFAPYTIYALIINVIPWFHPENDGTRIQALSKNQEQRDAVDRFYAIQKWLYDGKTYAEIPDEYFNVGESVTLDVKIPILVYALRRAIEKEDFVSVDELSKTIENYCSNDSEIVCELLCAAFILNQEDKIRGYSKVLERDLNESEPFVLRARLVYAKYQKDEQYFNVLKPTAVKVSEGKTFLKGDALYNKKLIEKL